MDYALRTALLIGSTFLTFAASAQEADPTEIVVTAQKSNQTQVIRAGSIGVLGNKDAADVPFSVKSYGEALILNQQPQTLGQVLENDPSVRTTFGFGNAAELFVIRGFPLFGDDIGFDGLYGLVPRQLIAPELYEQVQVLNGASAFLNGAAPGGTGVGGSVNLVPKRAGERDLTRLTANYSSDAHFGGSFDVARRFGEDRFGIRINGAARSGDVAIDGEFRSSYVVGGAFDFRGERARLSVDVAFQRVKVRQLRPKVIIASAAIPDVPAADANYGQPWSYSTLQDVFGQVRGEYDLSDNAMVYAAFGARDGSEDGIYGGITVNDAVTGAATGSALFVPRTDNNETAQAGMRVRLKAGGVTQEFNFGGSMIWQVNRNAFDFLGGFGGFPTNLYNPVPVPLPGTGFVGGDLDSPFPVARNRLGSAFVSNTIGLWEDRILFTAGMRLQTINVKSYAYADGALQTEYSEEAITPVLGLVVKPLEGVSLFANRIEGLAQGPTAPIDPTIVNSGEVFAPFRSTQYEVGGKVAFGRFNASLALYQTEQPSAFAVPVSPGSPSLIYGIFGKQRNRGVEVSVDGELADGLRLIAGGSVNNARLRETSGAANDGNRAVGVPDYLLNANVEWDLPFVKAMTLTGRGVHTGKQQVNAANTLEIPSWTRFDVGARYVAVVGQMPLTLRFNIDNVANKRYWASSFDSFGAALLQGAPRTFKLSASIEL